MDGPDLTLNERAIAQTSDTADSSLQVGGFLVSDKLGSGGMATVYKAAQLSPCREVALKVLNVELRGDERFIARIEREAELQASLQHPHIVPIYQSGVADGAPFIAMMLVDGPTLLTLIRLTPPEADDVIEILNGVASALDYAHARGVIHGDVKPQNILIDSSSHAWLADFGLTRMVDERTGLTSVGAPLGSFDYLAPEIADGRTASAASDVYSLAVTAFHALTGSLPFPASRNSQSLLAHAHAPRPGASERCSSLPPSVDDVLRAGMAVDPSARPSSPGALMADLSIALGLEPATPCDLKLQISVSDQRPGHGRLTSPDAVTQAPTTRPDSSRVRSGARRPVLVGGLLAFLVVVVVAAIVIANSGSHHSNASAANGPVIVAGPLETVGGTSHTWSDYKTAGGLAGETIPAYTAVKIACRIKGFVVADGDVWWYRLAASPWNNKFYVSADAFYNDGRTHGSLLRTPYFDPKVPVC